MPTVTPPWTSPSLLPPPVFFPRGGGRPPSHIHQPFPPAPQMLRPAMLGSHHNHLGVPRNPMRRTDSRRGRDRWSGGW